MPGSSLDLALKLVPTARRAALSNWASWWHDTSSIVVSVHDNDVAQRKLHWWLQELERAALAQAQHPQLRTLAQALGANSPLWPLAQQHIQALLVHLGQSRWLDEASLSRHARQDSGAVFAAAAILLGAEGPQASEAAHRMGHAVHRSLELNRLGWNARAGWLMVGIDTLQRHGLKAHELLRPSSDATPAAWAPLLADLLAQQLALVDDAVQAWRALAPKERRLLKPLVFLVAHAGAVLQEMRNTPALPPSQRIILTPLRKAWLAQCVRWGLRP